MNGGIDRMFERIAICLDGSTLAEQIIPYATEQARRFGSVPVLLRVVSSPVLLTPGIPGSAGSPLVTGRREKQAEKEEQESDKYLQAIAARLHKEYQLKAECVTLIGPPGQTIVEYSADNGIGLIAIATHGRTGPGRVLFGSVADYVVKQSRLPILLIRPTI
jgi:nucleotide-binding universal stress UspA family protein